MKPNTKGSRNLAWRGTCATCAAAIDLFRTIAVLLLAIVTAFTAYVATREELPVPKFLVHAIRDSLHAQGAALDMRGIRLLPDGRVIIEAPTLRSTNLNANLAAADFAQAHINLPSLLIGRFDIDRITVSDGRLLMPAMLSASGLEETVARSIHFDLQRKGGAWHALYGNAKIANASIAVSGPIKKRFLQPPRPRERPAFSLAMLNRQLAENVARWQQQLAKLQNPALVATFDLDSKRRQTARIELFADTVNATSELFAERLVLLAELHETEGARFAARAESLALPQSVAVSDFRLRSDWSVIPRPETARFLDWLPNSAELTLGSIRRGDLSIPGLVASAGRERTSQLSGQAAFTLAGSPWELRFQRNLASGKTRASLDATLSEALPRFFTPLAQELAGIDLVEMAWLRRDADLSVESELGRDWKPTRTLAFVDTGRARIRGAEFDRARARARFDGLMAHVEEIQIRSGMQAAEIAIHIDPATLSRRILLEGNVDPRMINGWFKPWWAAMWNGMEFPAEGMYTAMDSRGIFGQPDAVRVTGIGYVTNMDLRTLPVAELRLRYFSKFRYVDLYEIELTTDRGQAFGNTQFALDRDPRDERDKLTAIWIDADSTLDLKRGPDVLWEISKPVSNILDPYDYEAPPRVVAKTSSVMRQDVFQNDIDLQLDSDEAFSFFDFPFESVHAKLHIANGRIEAPNVRAGVGGGELLASATIVDDQIEIDARLQDAAFGETLVAANKYFAASGSERAAETKPEELLRYSGNIQASFAGKGLVDDPLSYEGAGSFDIDEADFGTFRLFGLLSLALEITPFRFSTLKFTGASGNYEVRQDVVRVRDAHIDGPVAAIDTSGTYNLAQDTIDFRARLFPFRNSRFPIIAPLLNVALTPVSHALSVSATGPFSDPKISLLEAE